MPPSGNSNDKHNYDCDWLNNRGEGLSEVKLMLLVKALCHQPGLVFV